MDTKLKELRDKMAEMMVKMAALEDGVPVMVKELRDKMAEMMVESKKAGVELQLQQDKMVEMMVESRMAGAKLQLQKGKMAEMMVELQLQKDKMAEMELKMAALEAPKEVKKPDDELRRIQQYEVDVTLDPETANPYLILSEDGQQVSDGGVRKNLPDNPERFSKGGCVLGKQGFSSGRFYYEVQVGGKTAWDLGVVRVSIDRKVVIIPSPNNGFWSIALFNGDEYCAAADLHDDDLHVKGKLQKVGVFVDYEEGLVSFYDVEARVHLYSFTGCSFTEKLFPYFNPGNNDGGINSAPLIIHTPSMH